MKRRLMMTKCPFKGGLRKAYETVKEKQEEAFYDEWYEAEVECFAPDPYYGSVLNTGRVEGPLIIQEVL